MVTKKPFYYVSLGDSIAAGHTIDAGWASNYGEGSQFSCNGRTTPTTLVPGCYTYLINNELKNIYGNENVVTTSFARSGDTVQDLMQKLDHSTYGPIMKSALQKAQLVTVCVGANDILQPAMLSLGDYVATGDLSGLTAIVNNNLANLKNDSYQYSYVNLFNKLRSINPNAKYIFTTIYNPYKYLYVDPNRDGFFQPLLDLIPPINYEIDLGFTKYTLDISPFIKDAILQNDYLKLLFNRVNRLSSWVEGRIDGDSSLNAALQNRMNTYRASYPNFYLADTKAFFDKIPDRGDSSSGVHYNDLISVEYTRNYDTADMNWGALWGNDAWGYWWNLASKRVGWSGGWVWEGGYPTFDAAGFIQELGADMVERVIIPDVDPHPEPEGHKLLKRSFCNTYGLIKYDIDKYHNIGDAALANTQLYSSENGFDATMWCEDSGRATPLNTARTDYTNYKTPSSFTLGELVSGSSIRIVEPKVTTIYYKEDKARGLRVWLPLIDHHKNQGLSDLSFKTVNNTTTVTSGGKLNYTTYFNSSTAAGGLISDKPLDIPESTISMFAWIKPGDASMNPMGIGGMHTISTINSSYDAGVGMGFQIISSNGKRVVAVSTGDGKSRTWSNYCGNTNLSLDTWYHVGFTYDGATIKIYVNGNLDGEYTYTNQKNVHDYVYVFGWSRDGTVGTPTIFDSTYKFVGSICDFRIYDSVLSKREVKELAKGLALHYKFSNESGNLALSSWYERSGSEYRTATYQFDRQGLGRYLSAGEKCTLTVCFTPPANFSYWFPHLNEGAWGGWMPNIYSDGTTNRQIASGVSSDGWVYYQDPNSNSAMSNICMYWKDKNGNAGSGNVTIHWLRLDLGDKSYHYWSPAISEYPTMYLTEHDRSGYGNHASRSGIMPSMKDSGRYDSSTLFNNSAYVRNTTCDTRGWTDFTMAAWVNPSKFDGERSCILIGGIYLTVDNIGRVSTYCYGKSNEGYHDSNGKIPLNQWSHIAAVWNNSTGTVKLYINGKLDKTVSGVTGAASQEHHKKKEVGLENGIGRPFYGKMSDLRLYATALSDEDVQELYGVPVVLTNNGTLLANEFIESSEQNFKRTGVVNAGSFTPTTALTSDMKLKAMPDGSTWARINWIDFRSNKTPFQSDAEVASCSTNNRYSRMGLVDTFRGADNTYEFMINYPSKRQYAPAGYTLLDCIEATGSQYIETGVKGNARWEFDIKFNKSGIRQLMGYNSGAANYWGITKEGLYESGVKTFNYEHKHRENVVFCFGEGSTYSLYVNHEGMDVTPNDVSGSVFTLFKITGYEGTNCWANLYRCKCHQGGRMVRDFIPVRRNTDNQVGLYDLVNNQFYGNSGSGAFIAHEVDKYIPIEYVEFTGNQYIDTKFASSNGFIFDMKWSYNSLSGCYIVGSHNEGSPYGRNGIGLAHNTYWELGTGENCPSSSTTVAANTQYRLQGSTIVGNSYLNVNGSRVISTTDNTARSSYNILVGSNQYSLYHGHGSVSGKLYYLKMYDSNGNLVRDFIPVTSTMHGCAGLYDLIEQKFYHTVNNTWLRGGGIPEDQESPYEFLDYIQSTGSARIDTGITPTTSTVVDIKFAPTGSMTENSIIGSTWSAAGYFLMFYQNRLRWHSRNGVVDMNGTTNNSIYGCRCSISSAIVNGTQYNISGSGSDSTNNLNIFTIPGQETLSGHFKLYYCDIYQDGILRRSLHPVRRRSDSVIGLYDSITGGFYTNVGSGSLLSGSAIAPKTPIESSYRWIQTNSPNVSYGQGSGYKPIMMSQIWGDGSGDAGGKPLTLSNSQGGSRYSANGRGDWWTPVGQKTVYGEGVPSTDSSVQLSQELWVRYDRLPAVSNFSIQKHGSMGLRNFIEI